MNSSGCRCCVRIGDDSEKRLAKIQEAMAALEADAKLAAEEERRIEAENNSSATLKAARSRANRRHHYRTNLIDRLRSDLIRQRVIWDSNLSSSPTDEDQQGLLDPQKRELGR